MHNEHIEFNAFSLGLRATDKNQILQNISWKIGRQTAVDMTWLSEQLIISESNESSGIGDGVAIAHLKSTPLKKPFIMVARLDHPVEFDAIDGLPVDLICAVLSPQMDGPLHLRRLSRVTRIFREPIIVERLRQAVTEDEMASILKLDSNHDFMAA